MTSSYQFVLCFAIVGLIPNAVGQLRGGQSDKSRGTFLGYFETMEHDVSGAVWALDDEWLHVEGFTYDGRGPDAFFWVGTEGDQPSPQGHIVPFPSGASGEREMVLPAFSGENVLFRLPDGVKVSQLRWISVWCRRFTVNFGSLRVPPNLNLPKKRKLAELSRLAHGVRSGNVTLLDSKTIYIPNLHYDGAGPDAYFWVGRGVPDRTGKKIPNEKKSLSPLEAYEGVDIELVLPDNLTIYDIDYLALWCVKFTENFGDVKIPSASEMFLPPALGQTQVKNGSELHHPLRPGAKDQYDTTTEVYTTAQLPVSPGISASYHSNTTLGLTRTNKTSTQVSMTVHSNSDSFNGTHDSVTLEMVTDSSAATEITHVNVLLESGTEKSVVNKSGVIAFLEKSFEHTGLASSTTEVSHEISTMKVQGLNETQMATDNKGKENKTEESLRKGKQVTHENLKQLSDDSKVGIENIGGEVEVMPSKFYLATPDEEKDYVFRYGLAKNMGNIRAFDTNDVSSSATTNTSGVVLGDFGGLPNKSLSENEYTFKYDVDPEIQPVSRNESEITEILVHEAEGRYRYSVGNDHVIQHVIDNVNFDPQGLVVIDSQRHRGANFYGLPAHTDHESETLESHSHEHGGHHEGSGIEKHHPKDVYSANVHVNLAAANSSAPTTEPGIAEVTESAKEVNGSMANVTEGVKNVTAHAENVTAHAENVTAHAENVTEHAKNVTEHAKSVTEHAGNVTEQAKNVTEQAKNVTEHAKNVTEQAKNVTESKNEVTESVKNATKAEKTSEKKEILAESKPGASGTLALSFPEETLMLLLAITHLGVWFRV